jgi:hypothetical protein
MGFENLLLTHAQGLVANGARVYVVALGSFDKQVQALNTLGSETGGTAHAYVTLHLQIHVAIA